MKSKEQWIPLAAIFSILAILLASYIYIFFIPLFAPQPKPETPPQILPRYDRYMILDETDGRYLMDVPVIVHIGDEVLTEENHIYKVIRLEENRAYARFIEKVNLEKYK